MVNAIKSRFDNAPETVKVSIGEPNYPDRLRELFGKSIPQTIYMKGNSELLFKSGVGFCGSRKAEDIALKITKDCAAQVVDKNLTVVSGYAAGVDITAHYTALEKGGDTIIVLPEGINHFKIKKSLSNVWDWSRVLVISHFEPDATWKAWRAMQRNKTIMALSNVMIVISAGEKGGTLDAGLNALKHKISLYVADYNDAEIIAPGNQRLINEGGKKLGQSQRGKKPNLNKLFSEIYYGPEQLNDPQLKLI